MTDTNHIEVLREMRESWTELGSKAYDKYVAACDAAITALSARASAGEGVRVCRFAKCDGSGYYAGRAEYGPCDCALPATAAPQPAQAGASGGGDVPDDVAERCQTYDSARLLQCALEVYARSCMYNTEAQHNAAMAYRDELLRRLTPTSTEPREAFAWMKAGPRGTPLLHTVTQNIKIREEWEANGWVSIPIFLPTPPAHGDGEGVAELLAKLPSLETLDAVDDDLRRGTRPCPLNNLTINDVKLLHRALTTRPTPEARDAQRFIVLRDALLGANTTAMEYFKSNGAPTSVEQFNAYCDAALALPAQGEGKS